MGSLTEGKLKLSVTFLPLIHRFEGSFMLGLSQSPPDSGKNDSLVSLFSFDFLPGNSSTFQI